MRFYIMTCARTGESEDLVVCNLCALHMPAVDGLDVSAYPADTDLLCELCNSDEGGKL